MIKKQILFIFAILFSTHLIAEDVVGFWKTIDDETKKPQSIVGIYEHEGKYFGRIILTYNDKGGINDSIENPKNRAPGVVGEPYYAGMDIMWDLKKEGSKYTDGRILDPEKGRIYHAEMWPDRGNLIVRGEVWIFGANQEWLPAANDFPAGFSKPDLKNLIPTIPQAKPKHHEVKAHPS
jgi:uncharacterized protein (DUF2147 family)